MEWWCHAVARAVSVSLVSFFLLPVHYDAAAQLTKVRISYSSRSNSNTPFIIALNKGFFAEEGMDVELIQVIPVIPSANEESFGTVFEPEVNYDDKN